MTVQFHIIIGHFTMYTINVFLSLEPQNKMGAITLTGTMRCNFLSTYFSKYKLGSLFLM